jgi:hypothetical protein
MKKLPTAVKAELINLSKKLPPLEYSEITEQHQMSGDALLMAGVNQIKNGQEVKKSYKYVSEPQKKQVDHFKVLRKIWLKSKSESEAWQKIKTYEAQATHRYNQTKNG